MKSLRILVMITASLALGGCGDDGGDDPPVDSGTDLVDACLNSSDEAVLMSDGGDASGIATDCATGPCIGDLISGDTAAATACIVDCMGMSAVGGLSDDCTSCYIDTALCGASICIAECISDASSPACQMCLDTQCTPAFYTCSGLTP